MFRRLWTGLPKDPDFPEDLEKLGYFVNENDEIRNIENPRYYFKYFFNKNMHWNDRQRFAFNTATQNIILDRLAQLGLEQVRLPLGAADDEPHVRVLATVRDLATAQRIVVFVGETAQDLGVLAHRVVGGKGGIRKGSLVSMVEALRGRGENDQDDQDDQDRQDKQDGKDGKDGKGPAIVICNPGELFWWPEGRRALSLPMREGMPRPSAAHTSPRTVAGINTIPGHTTADEHVASVFRDVLGPAVRTATGSRPSPRISCIAIAGGADAVEGFLDNVDHWQRWGPHMDSLAVLGGLYEAVDIKTDTFRAFLRQRARAYIPSEAPVGFPVAGPDGNAQAARTTHYGCPVHSSGTMWLTELMFIDAQAGILAWSEAVARDPMYVNPEMEITYAEVGAERGNEEAWEGVEEVEDEKEKDEKDKDEKDKDEKNEDEKEKEDEKNEQDKEVQEVSDEVAKLTVDSQ